MLGHLAWSGGRVGVGMGGVGPGLNPTLLAACGRAWAVCILVGPHLPSTHTAGGEAFVWLRCPAGWCGRSKVRSVSGRPVASWSPVSLAARCQWDESGKGGMDGSLQSLPSRRLALLPITTSCPPLWWSWVSRNTVSPHARHVE